IDAGGDFYAAGIAPGNEVWRIGIASPNQADVDLEAVELHEQAIVTSTTATRRWRRGGQLEHHLIDPTAGRPRNRTSSACPLLRRRPPRRMYSQKQPLFLAEPEGRHVW